MRPPRLKHTHKSHRGWLVGIIIAAGIAGAAPAQALDNTGEGQPTITIGTTSADTAGGGSVLKDVKLVYAGPNGGIVNIATLTATGLKQSQDRLDAAEIVVDGLIFHSNAAGAPTLEIQSARLRGVSAPALSAHQFSLRSAPGRLPPLAALLLQLKLDAADIPSLTLRSASSTVTYKHIVLSPLAGGKLAEISLEGITSAEKNDRMTSGRGSLKGLDLNVAAAWLDDALAARAPAGLATLYARFELEGIDFSDAKSSGSIGKFSIADFKLAAPGIKPSELAALIGRMSSMPGNAEPPPDEIVRLVRVILPAFSLGNLELDNLVTKDVGKAPVTVDLFRIDSISGTGIGEIRFGGVAGQTNDDNTPFTLGSASLRGIGVTNLDPLFDALSGGRSPDSLSSDQYPQIRAAGLAVTDFAASSPHDGPIRLEGLTVDTPVWTGLMPSILGIHLKGLTGAVANIEDAQSRKTFEALGLKTLNVNADVNLAWKEADQTLAFGPSSLEIEQVVKVSIDGVLGNVSRNLFTDPVHAILTLFLVDFRGGSGSIEEGGGIAKMMDVFALENGVSAEQMAEGVRALTKDNLGGLIGGDNAARIGDALKAFMLKPGTIRIGVRTSQPIQLAPLFAGADAAGTVLETLKNSIAVDVQVK